MATITIEIGRKGKKKMRPVSFLVCHRQTKKRIPTEIHVTDSEISSNGKRVKAYGKAMLLEHMRRKLEDKLMSISLEIAGRRNVDAAYIVRRMSMCEGPTGFFEFAEEWMARATVKGLRNYKTMLRSLEAYNGGRSLEFSEINFRFLTGFEDFLNDKPRAKSLYIGHLRHLYREAMLRYNSDEELVIKNDPFLRYRVPRQAARKGVRALTLEDFLKVYACRPTPGGRAEIARDAFVLSFCLMGMNSADMYECTDFRGGILRYCRAKTRDRRSDGAYIEVRVHPIVSDLMEKYRGRKRVFSFCERYADASTFNKSLNAGLKEVGRTVGIEGLQFYQARHTFATLSRNLMRFSKSDVDEALNHVGDFGIADIYIVRDFSIINDNNFRLIERVFCGKK